MISTFSLSTQRARFAGIALACAGLLIWGSCDENPVLEELPGGSWVFQRDTIFSMVDTSYQRSRLIGGSTTLYAGQIVQLEQDREVGALLRFSDVDSAQLADFDSARVLIFHRSFADSLAPPSEPFTLERINPSSSDTIWAESDTGLFELPLTDSIYSAILDSDSVLVFTGSNSSAEVMADYLEFAIGRQVLLDWRSGVLPNNGFLLRVPAGSGLASFYSSESSRRPYLVVNYRDTTETGADTTQSGYYLVAQDISVYPYWAYNQPVGGTFLLNRSDGHRVHINFSDSLKAREISDSLAAREPRPVAGARLVFNVDHSATMMLASALVLQVWLRTEPRAQGDSNLINHAAITYRAHSDSLVFDLTSLLVDYQNKVRNNYGFDFVVQATNHDFDRLVLYGPRLEIVYAVPYGVGQ
ncbi:MAG: hypothetical protein IH972_01890 [Candidatus Marinimicrobia bacterium]|nr:hypothetical protein [Candidatus Neomarinimicrobiota bacterium]